MAAVLQTQLDHHTFGFDDKVSNGINGSVLQTQLHQPAPVYDEMKLNEVNGFSSKTHHDQSAFLHDHKHANDVNGVNGTNGINGSLQQSASLSDDKRSNGVNKSALQAQLDLIQAQLDHLQAQLDQPDSSREEKQPNGINGSGSIHENGKPNGVNGTALSVTSKPVWQIPSTNWKHSIHPHHEEVAHEVDGYFLKEWKFPNAKAEKTFLAAGFSRVTCLYFPLSKDDRIHFACRLLTVLFLIDDVLEDMSLADGEAYNAHLIQISRGDVLPDRTLPAEYILYDLWESMRACDQLLANDVMESTFIFMRAQTDRVRLTIKELGHYLDYRERDVGKGLLSALMRFCMSLHLTPDELVAMKPLEQNCSKQISVVNDIYSWEKELKASQTAHAEGAVLCSAVKVLADETNLSIAASKRVLWAMTREWELVHDEMVAEQLAGGVRLEVKEYMKGLEYQMSGNEEWSNTTLRYR